MGRLGGVSAVTVEGESLGGNIMNSRTMYGPFGAVVGVTSAGDSGAGNFDMVLIFTNTSAKSCAITGYPGAAVDYANGTVLNAQRHMTAYLGGDSADTTPPTVTLSPGASASGLLNWSAGPMRVECLGTGTARLLVTAPGATNTVTLRSGIGGACENFSVTPVVPGSCRSEELLGSSGSRFFRFYSSTIDANGRPVLGGQG